MVGYVLFMFYVNEKNRVIQKVPGGKIKKNKQQNFAISYLKEDKLVSINNSRQREPQSAQKGGTCWYYATARKRYGKFYAGAERAIEIIISNHRKQYTALTQRHAFENFVLDQFEHYIEQQSLDYLTDKQIAEMILQNGYIKDKVASKLIVAFIRSPQKDTFRSFIEDEQAKEIIKTAKTTSRQLQYDIDSEFTALLAQDGIAKEDLELDSIANYYDFLIIHHIWKQQGYTQAHWHPNMGIESLMEELRHYSCLVEIDVSNVQIGTSTPSYRWYSTEDPGYLVHEVTSNDTDKEENETHIIRLIGADLEHIYFIDPNDASIPDEARIIHQISYPLFCNILLNGRGVAVHRFSDKAALPYLMYHIMLEDTLPYTPVQIRKRKNSEANMSFKITYADEVPEPAYPVNNIFVNQSNGIYSPCMFSNGKLKTVFSAEYVEEIKKTTLYC